MTQNSTDARAMVPGIDPRVDYAFKKLFGSEANIQLLLDLLQATLKFPPERQIVSLEVLNPFNDKDALDDKLSVLDIKARDQDGRQYNVEMQMLGSRTFPQRVLYYWAKLHAQQLHHGDDYRLLQPTISICFVDDILFAQVPEHHLHFELRSSVYPELVFSMHQTMHLVELPKFTKTAEQLVDPLDVWCFFLRHGSTLDTTSLPAGLRVPVVQRAMEVLAMLSQSDLERERYEARLKAERDHLTLIREAQYAREEGFEEGRMKGFDKGRAEGRAEGQAEGRAEVRGEGFAEQINLCERLLKLALTPRADLLARPLAELEERLRQLRKQLGVE